MIDPWRYVQLSLFIGKLPKPLRSEGEYRPLEQLCGREQSGGLISQIYKILNVRGELEVPPYIKKWERELESRCSKFTLEKILKMTHKSAVGIKRTEINFKCLARWYVTPDKISKCDPAKSE